MHSQPNDVIHIFLTIFPLAIQTENQRLNKLVADLEQTLVRQAEEHARAAAVVPDTAAHTAELNVMRSQYEVNIALFKK